MSQSLEELCRGTRTDPRLHWVVNAGDLALFGLILAGMWTNGASWTQLGMAAALHLTKLGCYTLIFWLQRRAGWAAASHHLAVVVTIVFNTAVLHLADWGFGTFSLITFTTLALNTFTRQHVHVRIGAWLGAVALCALVDGHAGLRLLASIVVAVVITVVTEAWWHVIKQVTERARLDQHEAVEAKLAVERMQRELLEREKLSSLGLLAAGLAHEINNPMAYVTSNLTALARDLPGLPGDPSLLAEYHEEVLPETLDGVRRVNTIVADLRRFARGDLEGSVEFDVNDEVRAAMRIAHTRLGPGCRSAVELGVLPRIEGRPQQITQVLVNLLVNAGQAARSAVTVRTWADAECVAIAVEDDGPGIRPEHRARLFQPFFTTKPPGEGTGLGLSVAHGIVTAHRGTISVETATGVGTTFTVRIPLPAVESDPPPELRRVA